MDIDEAPSMMRIDINNNRKWYFRTTAGHCQRHFIILIFSSFNFLYLKRVQYVYFDSFPFTKITENNKKKKEKKIKEIKELKIYCFCVISVRDDVMFSLLLFYESKEMLYVTEEIGNEMEILQETKKSVQINRRDAHMNYYIPSEMDSWAGRPLRWQHMILSHIEPNFILIHLSLCKSVNLRLVSFLFYFFFQIWNKKKEKTKNEKPMQTVLFGTSMVFVFEFSLAHCTIKKIHCRYWTVFNAIQTDDFVQYGTPKKNRIFCTRSFMNNVMQILFFLFILFVFFFLFFSHRLRFRFLQWHVNIHIT